jgi:hypothetical protein
MDVLVYHLLFILLPHDGCPYKILPREDTKFMASISLNYSTPTTLFPTEPLEVIDFSFVLGCAGGRFFIFISSIVTPSYNTSYSCSWYRNFMNDVSLSSFTSSSSHSTPCRPQLNLSEFNSSTTHGSRITMGAMKLGLGGVISNTHGCNVSQGVVIIPTSKIPPSLATYY